MGYNIMLIDRKERFKNCLEFDKWYNKTTEWKENVDYNDYCHATKNLQSFYLEIIGVIKPMNGKYAPSIEEQNNTDIIIADYCISKEAIYMDIAYSDITNVFDNIVSLAKKHNLALFDISSNCILIYNDGSYMQINEKQILKEKIESETKKLKNKRGIIGIVVFIVYAIICGFFIPHIKEYKNVWLFTSLALVGIISIWVAKSEKDILNKYQKEIETINNQAVNQKPTEQSANIVVWEFGRNLYNSEKDFSDALMKYNEEILGNVPNHKIINEIIAKAPKIRVIYEGTNETEDSIEEKSIELTASNQSSFTLIEVLYKLNQVLHEELKKSDFVYYEGLEAEETSDETPCFRMFLGS